MRKEVKDAIEQVVKLVDNQKITWIEGVNEIERLVDNEHPEPDKVSMLKKELQGAIREYGEDHVDVVLDSENKTIYGTYHSRHNSFPVTANYSMDIMSTEEIEKLANELGIGYTL